MSKNIPKERKHKKKKKKTSKPKTKSNAFEKMVSDTFDFFNKLIEETNYFVEIATIKKPEKTKNKVQKDKRLDTLASKPSKLKKPRKTDAPYQTILDKLKVIRRDAKDHYKNGHYGEYIMLKYLSIEILAKALYIKILHKEISKENDLNLSEIIKAIQRELNINFGILEELNEWRLIRNKIVHEHFKIGEKVAAKAKVFFSDSVKLLKRQLVN